MTSDNYSADPSPRTVEPRECLVDASTIARVQRAMAGNCHECRGGKRKNMSGRVVSCRLCNGTGRMAGLTVAQIANAAAVGIEKTLRALDELERRRSASFEMSGGCEMWRILK